MTSRQLQSQMYQVLVHLEKLVEARDVDDIAKELGLDQAQVMAVLHGFVEDAWVSLEETSFQEIALEQEGTTFLASEAPLLERRIAELLQASATAMGTLEIAEALGVESKDVGRALRFVMSKGYAAKAGKELIWAGGSLEDLQAEQPDEALLARLAASEAALWLSEAEATGLSAVLKDLRSRSFIKIKPRKQRTVQLTETGRAIIAAGITEVQQVNQLTEEMLLSGTWRDMTFRPYDVQLDTAAVYPGKAHPLRRVLEETREAFLRMGFTEIRGPYVESAFWDFDALFQPQDHPAREMQDTFYCEAPAAFPLGDPALVETIRRTHETGGDTGSTGWRYTWSDEKAKQVVLRTHTTAVTVAACHQNPAPPQKLFCVGRVFRRETIDYKHLPEFHQVDGIIVDQDASFASLLGTLKAFYLQMGFSEVKFRPAFFPYTEPSVEVFVRMPGRKEWFELGGAGVFRPEVVQPAGVTVPVLAWGLGLERLAMVRYGVTDIRELYRSHLNWLKESALCQ